MRLAVSLVFWASLLTGATVVAIRRPGMAVRLAKGALALLAAVWALTCLLGIASVVQRGRGGQGILRATSVFDSPHIALSHAVVVLLFVALCACVPFAIERAVRQGGAGRLTVHLTLALATHWLVLATVFTGYLIRPPVTEGRVLRFAVLHVVAAPLLATLTLVGWLLVARRYRVTDA